VGFLLTTPMLGMMYYFLPKAAERPVYSYRLSIIHFWALVFLYIWAGPHHLLYSGLPDWAQTLGMIFSIVLIAPSWGGMLNGLLTLRGAWDRLRSDPVLKFFVVGITFYGMSTFEGPMMSIRAVNALSHYTDWTIGHVHSGALGWVGMSLFAIGYYLVPRLWNRPLHNEGWATAHFWLATIGIVLYIVAMWVSGITQGLMWRAIDDAGQLQYPNFLDTVIKLVPFYWIRLGGGLMYLSGLILMLVNIGLTISGSAPSQAIHPSPAPAK
jgi:cbb3-type cytochrome c oxidase subunit I